MCGEETAERMAFPGSRKQGTHSQAVYKITREIRSETALGIIPALLFITWVTWTRLLSHLSCRLSCHVETLPLSCVGVGIKCYGYVSLASDCNSHTDPSYPHPPQIILHISAWHPKVNFKILDRIMQLPHFNPSMAGHHPENKSTGLPWSAGVPRPAAPTLSLSPLLYPLGSSSTEGTAAPPLIEHVPTHGLCSCCSLLLSTLPQIFTWLTPLVHQGLCSKATSSEHSFLTICQK